MMVAMMVEYLADSWVAWTAAVKVEPMVDSSESMMAESSAAEKVEH